MDCRQAVKTVEKYIDGRLDTEVKKAFEEHISTCNSCNNILFESKSLHDILATKEHISHPVDFTEKVMDAVLEFSQKNNEISKKFISQDRGVFFRRLGFSMLVTASILLVSLFVPLDKHSIFNKSVYAQSRAIHLKEFKVHNTIQYIDSKIERLFEYLNIPF